MTDIQFNRLMALLTDIRDRLPAPPAAAPTVETVADVITGKPDLRWFEDSRFGSWRLTLADSNDFRASAYDAWGDNIATTDTRNGATEDRASDVFPTFDDAIRQIIAWAEEDGYAVPPCPYFSEQS